jgi:hypothetical protein
MRALSVLCFLAVIGLAATAEARTTEELPWTFSQVYRTTIRLVRVDLGCEITERDEDAGYLTFDYESSGRVHHGSIEVIATEDAAGVRVIVQLSTLPSYVERMVLNRLERKLRDEIGEPRVVREPAPPAAPPPEEREPDGEPDEDDEPTHDASGEVPPGPYW